MKVDIYVSRTNRAARYAFLPSNQSVSLLPRDVSWRYVRSADTVELRLPEAIEEHIERRGFWAVRADAGSST
jgi:hypothetical protein